MSKPRSEGVPAMSRRVRIWLLALLIAVATSVTTLLATAAQAGIEGSGRPH